MADEGGAPAELPSWSVQFNADGPKYQLDLTELSETSGNTLDGRRLVDLPDLPGDGPAEVTADRIHLRVAGQDLTAVTLYSRDDGVIELVDSTANGLVVHADELRLEAGTVATDVSGTVRRLAVRDSIIRGDRGAPVSVLDVSSTQDGFLGSVITDVALPAESGPLSRICVAADQAVVFAPMAAQPWLDQIAHDQFGTDALLLLSDALRRRCPARRRAIRSNREFHKRRRTEVGRSERIILWLYDLMGYGESPERPLLVMITVAALVTVVISAINVVNDTWAVGASYWTNTTSLYLDTLLSPISGFDIDLLPLALTSLESWQLSAIRLSLAIAYFFLATSVRYYARPVTRNRGDITS